MIAQRSGQGSMHCVDVQADDFEGLGAACRALEQNDVRFGEMEDFREEGDEGGVGVAVHRGGGERDLQGSVVEAGDGVAPSSGMDAQGQGAAFGMGAEVGGFRGHGWICGGECGDSSLRSE